MRNAKTRQSAKSHIFEARQHGSAELASEMMPVEIAMYINTRKGMI